MPTAMWVSVAVNVLVGLGALIGLARWFRHWVIKAVSEPIAELKSAVADIKTETQRAHDRLDRHLEVHNA